ncbi:MAG: DUF3795 domain-containing protein [Candidatus Stahlbacteria bacterium]|nr:DUF3795 domain-containing protein [Candidatus Stahlbacteria bacterium]
MKKKLTGYCGLYCGDCSGYTGTIADLSRDIRKELRKAKFDAIAKVVPFKEFKYYKECYECLGAMIKLRCKGCRGGSRSKFCNIAKCVQKKNYEGCWECSKFEECKKLQGLEVVHKDAHIKNLNKIKQVGIKEWLKGKRFW